MVHLDAPGDTWLGPFEPQPARMDEVRQLAGLLTRGGLPTVALADSRGAQWTKLIFNSATSPVAALTGLTMGSLGATAEVRELVRGLVAEGRAVADALGITLDGDPMELIDDAAQHAAGHQPSMLQDVLARRATEIGVLNDGIVRQAQDVGVPVPPTRPSPPSSTAWRAPGGRPPRPGLTGGMNAAQPAGCAGLGSGRTFLVPVATYCACEKRC